MTFIDTSAIYAMIAAEDKNHQVATDVFTNLVTGGTTLLSTNYVLVESAALLQNRLGLGAVRTLHRNIAPLFEVDWVSEDDHLRALEVLLLAGRRKLSLVDCVSFRSMRKLGLTTAFAFDDHFREQGFTVVPEPAG